MGGACEGFGGFGGKLITSNWLFCSSSYSWAVLQSPRLGARSAPAGSATCQCDVHINVPLMHDSSDQTPLFHCTVGLFWCSCPPPASWTTVAPVLDLITLVSLPSVASSPAHSTDREHLSTTMSSWRTKMSICANYVSKYQSSSISTHYNGIWRSILEKSLKKAGMMKQAVTFNDCLTGGKTDRMMFFSSCQRPEIE